MGNGVGSVAFGGGCAEVQVSGMDGIVKKSTNARVNVVNLFMVVQHSFRTALI